MLWINFLIIIILVVIIMKHFHFKQEDSQRPKLFEWVDGPLVTAMKEGSMFLIDEISLADDSVLERLNSVLEPERSILLAEKGGGDGADDEVEVVKAADGFQVFATMNPGGDFGKKEVRGMQVVLMYQSSRNAAEKVVRL